MATKKRQVEAGEVKHLSGLQVEITFDRSDGVFRATYAGQSYQHQVINELKKIIIEAIDASLSIEWTPVIIVSPLSPGFGNTVREDFVGFSFDRKWITLFPDGQYRECQWNGKETDNMLLWAHHFSWDVDSYGPFAVPVTKRYYSDVTFYLPYSEELWAKLLYIQQKIKELRAMFLHLFESAEGLQFLLLSDWQLALPEPKKQEEGK